MAATQQLFLVYQKFHAQQKALADAPALTVDVSQMSADDFPQQKTRDELDAVVSYLMGVPDVTRLSFREALRIIQRTYQNQPFWKNLILDYFQLVLQEEQERLRRWGEEIRTRALDILSDIEVQEAEQRALIAFIADRIKPQNFPINVEKLVQNYLKMAARDPKKAWEHLISNPACFTPILVKDAHGNQTLSAEQAAAENKRLAQFLKSLKLSA